MFGFLLAMDVSCFMEGGQRGRSWAAAICPVALVYDGDSPAARQGGRQFGEND